MRITQQMLNNTMLRNMQGSLSRIDKWNEQLSSTKRINKPSDDPIGLTFALRYRSTLNANLQYQDNLTAALSWLEESDTLMGQSVAVMKEAKEMAVLAANGTNNESSWEAMASKVGQLIEQLHEIANSKFNDKYVFNGQKTDQKPYTTMPPLLADEFDTGKINYELSQGLVVTINYNAGEIYGAAADADNAFNTLLQFKDALLAGDEEQIQQVLGKLETGLDRMLGVWSDLGAKMNRVEMIKTRLEDEYDNTKKTLSTTEDADMPLVITNLKTAEHVYNATLAAGARIIQPTLLDFLR